MKIILALTSLLFLNHSSFSEMVRLSEKELHTINAQGTSALSLIADDISIVSEDFYLELGFDSGIPLEFRRLSITGSESTGYFSGIRPFYVGDFDNPITLSLQSDSHTTKVTQVTSEAETFEGTSLVFALPTGLKVNDNNYQVPDPKNRFNIATQMSLTHLSGEELDTWLALDGISVDNTYVKLWADSNKGLSLAGELNLHIDRLLFESTQGRTNNPSNDSSKQWRFNNINIFLPLGNTLYQPLYFNTTDSLDLLIEIERLSVSSAEHFYANVPKGYISVENIELNNVNSGGILLGGIHIQHLEVETHDL